MKTIVAATDGSAGADRAVALAAELAKTNGAKLILITSARTESEELREYARMEHATIGDMLEAQCRAILKQASRIAERNGAADIATHDGTDEPVEFIVRVAREVNADLIVVGRRGRGQLAGLLLGSVSQKLASLAPCPVLVVP